MEEGYTATQSWAPGAPPQPSTYDVRCGPGVPATPPASPAGWTVEQIWPTGQPPAPPRRPQRLRRWQRLRRLAGSALTVMLLAATGVVLYLRFHQAPLQLTEAVILPPTQTGCGADVTGLITTNGAAGTVRYQWLLRPGQQPPHPLSQSVIAGQRAVYVTDAVVGSGHGRASWTVTLQVLGPEAKSASTVVVLSC